MPKGNWNNRLQGVYAGKTFGGGKPEIPLQFNKGKK
jgi:hypothetical protein